jgi:hypothetical protein
MKSDILSAMNGKRILGICLKTIVFWNMTPYDPVESYLRFRGANYFHPQGRGISQQRNKQEANSSSR